MLLAALLDLDRAGLSSRRPAPGSPTATPGPLETQLRELIAGLGLGAELVVERGLEGGLRCTRVGVAAPLDPPLRRLADLEAVIATSTLTPSVRGRTLAALRRLALVEADLHGVDVAQVHFHEVGAIDTVVDVAGVFALVELLDVARVEHGPVPLGSGRVVTAHGTLGLPAPATLELLRGAPVFGGGEEAELTTPTGALLLSELCAAAGPLPALTVEGAGYGAGCRALERGPNLLRAIVGRPLFAAGPAVPGGASREAGLVLLETNLDDSTPEVLGHVQARLLEEGALDAWATPVFMKKGRPGAMLSILVAPEGEAALVDLLFAESSTFGVRRRMIERHVLAREWVDVVVEGEPLRVKVGRRQGRVVTMSPEYEDAVRVAAVVGLPLQEVMHRAAEAARGVVV
jgi:uncharacterized protein (TIGR00299 family) protein